MCKMNIKTRRSSGKKDVEKNAKNSAPKKYALELLANTPLPLIDRESIIFLLDYYAKRPDPKLVSRSFLLVGDPGVGKSFLATAIVSALGKEILFMGCEPPTSLSCRWFTDFAGLRKSLIKGKDQIIFLDDLNYIFNREDYDICSSDKRNFIGLLDTISKDTSKIFISTVNCLPDLDERMLDRVCVKINFSFPSEAHKRNFLEKEFSKHLNQSQIDRISKNSVGYNYRDLPELIRHSYRLGRGEVTPSSLIKALQTYRPTQMYRYKVENGITSRLSQVYGKERQKRFFSTLARLYKDDSLGEKLGLKRHNLLMLHGPAGTGKTFMARAFAGELGYPMLAIEAKNLLNSRMFDSIDDMLTIGKRYPHCVIFVDEAEKMLGNPVMGEDSATMGEFNRLLDGSSGEQIKCIFIFAVNDPSRMSTALMDRMTMIEFCLPNMEERKMFILKRINDAQGKLKIDASADDIARITDGLSFRGIQRLWNEAVFRFIGKNHPITSLDFRQIQSEIHEKAENVIAG